MVDEGSSPTILFANCWGCIKLLDELIRDVIRKVVGFDGHKSRPRGKIRLIVSLMGKHMIFDFVLINCNAPYNGILWHELIVPMEVTTSARFECIKITHQIATNDYNELAFDDHELSEVNDKTILIAYNK